VVRYIAIIAVHTVLEGGREGAGNNFYWITYKNTLHLISPQACQHQPSEDDASPCDRV
jgi:hypothetical protein